MHQRVPQRLQGRVMHLLFPFDIQGWSVLSMLGTGDLANILQRVVIHVTC